MELPDMRADELERFMADNGAILPLSEHDIISLRIRRRRRSIARHVALGEPWLPVQRIANNGAAHVLQQQVFRILILGDECESKIELATFLSSSGAASSATSAAVAKLSSPHLFAVKQSRMVSTSVAAADESTAASQAQQQQQRKRGTSASLESHSLVEVYVPPVTQGAQGLRLELMQHCDAVVLVYSIAQPTTLSSVVDGQWQQELDEAHLLRRREGNALLRTHSSQNERKGKRQHHQRRSDDDEDNSDTDGGGGAAPSLDDPPPLLLIGMDAELRNQTPHSNSATSPSPSSMTSSKAAVRAAQDLKATKYMEVFTGKAAHYKSVWNQLVACMEQRRQRHDEDQDTTSSHHDTQYQRDARLTASYARGCPLYEHLRPDPPKLSVDATQRQVRVVHTLQAAAGSGAHGDDGLPFLSGPKKSAALKPSPLLQEVQFAFTLDPSGPIPEPPTAGADVSPAHSWFLSTASRSPSSGLIALSSTPPYPAKVAAVAMTRCMFPSREAVLDLPRTAKLPQGFIDIATRTFQLRLPFDILPSSASSLAFLGVRYTLDGTEPTTSSPLYLGPVDLIHHSSGRAYQTMSRDDDEDFNEAEGLTSPYSPWPSHGPPPPRVVKYACVSDSTFRSDTATVLVPDVLDPPRVLVGQHDNTLRVEGALSPLAIYRYTIDGSSPSYTNGLEYQRPVTLPTSTTVVRMVCLPRLQFPSEETVVRIQQQFVSGGGQVSQTTHYNNTRTSASDNAGQTVPHSVQYGSSSNHGIKVESVQLHNNSPSRSGRSLTTTTAQLQRPGAPPATVMSSPHRNRRPSPSSSAAPSASTGNTVAQQQSIIATTRTATIRAELNHVKRQQEAQRGDVAVMLVAPGSRGASPIVRSRGGTPERSASSPWRGAPAAGATGAGAPAGGGGGGGAFLPSSQYAMTPERSQQPRGVAAPSSPAVHSRERSPQRTTAVTKGPHGGTSKPAGNTKATVTTATTTPAAAAGAPAPAVGCVAAENQVDFAFPNPISLSHITVATPGGGQGPRSFEIFVVLQDTESWMGVGSGDLDDHESVQSMPVVPSARMMPVIKVRCVFGGPTGGGSDDDLVGRRPRTFVVRDMKIHGKPFPAINRPPPQPSSQYQWES